ncbi:Peroxisome biogenesis protein 19-1 AltName: Full=Peroxin-19-1 [Rhizoctonia solani AG-1 IB]|uniref:PEX19 protein n=1 Tax=Thanatephorus cucumeris (strain AG1-IB / isolate 7/3/14) TaxID=1108050 RepID=M5C412_THACB|nr:Peroxisome biogenesis protein 19-1 AltName: Full=Peroxin-19-1 [Rhizoctonia solani AG-1 IB]
MTTPSSNTGKPPAPEPRKVEEEDLDELDDLLDQFTPAPAVVPQSASKPIPPSAATKETSADGLPEDFEAALMREMEAMMRGESADAASSNPGANDLASAWQKMLIGDLEGTSTQEDMSDLFKNLGINSDPNKKDAEADANANADTEFQRTIRQAMDKLKSSDENARASGSGNEDDFADFLKQLSDGGDGNEDGLKGMIENMMGQLMGKEILYEPLVEMNDKFPGYFAEHPNLPEADLKRHKAQQAIVKQLVEIYQKPNYSDDDKETGKEVLRLMNEMQELGSPPTEVMGEVPPGFDFNSPEGMAKVLDSDGCVIS